MSAGGPVVSVHVWRVLPTALPAALVRVARGRRPDRSPSAPRFVKTCGATRSGAFGLRDTDPRRFLLLASHADAAGADRFDRGPRVSGWSERCEEHFWMRLRPLSAHGRWAGCTPFGSDARDPGADGPVAAITRARLAVRHLRRFWRAVPPAARALEQATPAPLAAFGFGEAPIGVQGTFSLWPDLASMRHYAYGTPEHRAVVARTPQTGWYAESLFARCAVLAANGTLDGRDPLAGTR